MQPNPYSPGAVPVYLAGRGTELETIRARLARTRMLGRSGGPLLAFYGSRGLGKTSLMHVLAQTARDARYLVVYITCGASSTFEEMARTILGGVSLRYHTEFGPTSAGFASGWMRIRGARRRRAVDRGFVLSDLYDGPLIFATC